MRALCKLIKKAPRCPNKTYTLIIHKYARQFLLYFPLESLKLFQRKTHTSENKYRTNYIMFAIVSKLEMQKPNKLFAITVEGYLEFLQNLIKYFALVLLKSVGVL